MAYNHKQNIEELIHKAGLPEIDTFDYSDHDPFKVVELYFQFCQTNLSENCREYDIQPALIYIHRSMNVNAKAGKLNNIYIIGVNFGTILTMFRFYTDHRHIFESDTLKEYAELHEKLNVSLDYLLYQISSQFTFYHELAHLIQKSPLTHQWMQESYENISPENDSYSLQRHVLEFDSDLHGSNNVVFHLIEFWKKQEAELKTPHNLSLLLSLGVAGVMSYFIFLMRKYDKVYYKASTHPHPIVRISYIVDNFVKVARHNLPDIKIVDPKTILQKGFIIVDTLFSLGGQNLFKDFSIQYFENLNQIEEYVNLTLIPAAQNMPELAMNRIVTAIKDF